MRPVCAETRRRMSVWQTLERNGEHAAVRNCDSICLQVAAAGAAAPRREEGVKGERPACDSPARRRGVAQNLCGRSPQVCVCGICLSMANVLFLVSFFGHNRQVLVGGILRTQSFIVR